jgi:hypothetical protein
MPEIEKPVCEYCAGKPVVGIHCPSDFDDREGSRDGRVFVAKCDECDVYDNDVEAAEAVSKLTGWPIHRSYDRDDNADPQLRAEYANEDYFRCYFAVTLAEASEKVG